MNNRIRFPRLATALAVAAAFIAPLAHAAWEPTKPVEFVVPAGTGGGADQMARLIQGISIFVLSMFLVRPRHDPAL